MSPPVAETHPAEVVFAVEALHVIAAPVLLNANVALGAILGVGRDIVGSLAIISALGQPSPAIRVDIEGYSNLVLSYLIVSQFVGAW